MKNKILTGLLPEEISALLPPGKEKYRGMQIFRWIHQHGTESFSEMTNLAKSFREEIVNYLTITTLQQKMITSSADGETDKYLFSLRDGKFIESVVIRDGDRVTACISSQVGCRHGCGFCRTGAMRDTRNLTAGEIIEQMIKIKKHLRLQSEDITNYVFMGMGEPLDNFTAVSRAIQIMTMDSALGIGQRRITVSTCGIVPGIIKLAKSFNNVGLAISLNATNNTLRNRLMPVNRKYPLEKLLDAARTFTSQTGRRITFEYILIRNVNDSPDDAHALVRIAKSVPSKVNLIPFNEYDGSPFHRSDDTAVDAFQQILLNHHIITMLRKSKGSDIFAACGQLAAGTNSPPSDSSASA